MQKARVYKIPTSGTARENLRKKGQFWTPDWVSDAMAEYVLADKGGMVLDPAVGAGAFFRAVKRIAGEKGLPYTLFGMDIDANTLDEALQYGLSKDDMKGVHIGDFIYWEREDKFPAILANPPYIRHHRISFDVKEKLKQLSMEIIGTVLDGRAGLHIYFLVRALTLLEKQGRLAFLMPADTCEGKFADDLWQWITKQYCLDAVVTFTPEASPFPDIDTNPLVFFIRNDKPQKTLIWAICSKPGTETLKKWVRSGFQDTDKNEIHVWKRNLFEGLQTGFSRTPFTQTSKYVLGDFIRVVRGVVTGSNQFFFLTNEQIQQLGIPEKYFVRAIGRTRDVLTEEITQETLAMLHEKGRPTFLLSLQDEPFEQYPETLKAYLILGEKAGLPRKPLISQRKPWYKSENRTIPPFLFAYLGRRNSRFIRNTAKIIPLSSFLCVYPKHDDHEFNERLWNILNHPDIISNLPVVGKSYGDGAIKVEPRSLEKLPIPDSVIQQVGLPGQLRLLA